MRIKVSLAVRLPLKRKKKILLGNSRTVYARFQYEKLSLFCFLCGKLEHGESFYALRVRVDPSKFSFGWDITLRAPSRRGSVMTSRWLREPESQRAEKERHEIGRNYGDSNLFSKDKIQSETFKSFVYMGNSSQLNSDLNVSGPIGYDLLDANLEAEETLIISRKVKNDSELLRKLWRVI